MIAHKKVEIIIESVQKNKIIKLIEQASIKGYSIIPSVMGKGSHGYHDSKGLTSALSNTYIITVCTDQQAETLTTAIKPLVVRYGGICIISDVVLV